MRKERGRGEGGRKGGISEEGEREGLLIMICHLIHIFAALQKHLYHIKLNSSTHNGQLFITEHFTIVFSATTLEHVQLSLITVFYCIDENVKRTNKCFETFPKD